MGHLIADPLRTMVKTTMVKVANVVPVDLIHDLYHRVSMVDQAQVPLTEIPILRIPPVALDRDSSSSSNPTRRIIPSSSHVRLRLP